MLLELQRGHNNRRRHPCQRTQDHCAKRHARIYAKPSTRRTFRHGQVQDAHEQLLLLAKHKQRNRRNDQELPNMSRVCPSKTDSKKERHATPRYTQYSVDKTSHGHFSLPRSELLSLS